MRWDGYEDISSIFSATGTTGVVATALRDVLNDYEVDTVYKFQGREKNTIIISTVDDELTDFVDDPNLINVAVSRAKKGWYLLLLEMNKRKTVM